MAGKKKSDRNGKPNILPEQQPSQGPSILTNDVPPTLPSSVSKKYALKRMRSWYALKSKRYRVLLWTLLIVIAVLLTQLGLQAGLSIHSLRSNDLVLFVHTPQEAINLERGQTTPISFTLSASTLPLCQAQCTWSIEETGTGKLLAQGSDLFTSGEEQTYSTVVAASRREQVMPYQFKASCQSTQNPYCKSNAKEQIAVSVAVVTTNYAASEAIAHKTLLAVLASWDETTKQSLQALAALAELPDARLGSLRSLAQEDFYSLLEQRTNMQRALEQEDVEEAAALLGGTPSQALTSYESLRAQEQTLAENLNALSSNASVLRSVSIVANQTQRETLSLLLDALPRTQQEFTRVELATSQQHYDAFTDVFNQLAAYHTQRVHAILAQGQGLLTREALMACTIKAGPCPMQTNTPATLEEATQALQEVCEALVDIDQTYLAAEQAYFSTLDPNATRAQLEQQYNVSSVQSESGFALLAHNTRELARTGVLSTQNTSVRLAVPLQAANETTIFLQQSCPSLSAPLAMPTISVSASLPLAPNKELSFDTLAAPTASCCSVDGCFACEESKRYPVVFVHGHSFAQGTAPEGSLTAFAPIALELQNESYLYMGHVFPREDLRNIPYAEFSSVPSSMLFTTTYYFDSFPEEGTVSFVPQKSENIETYALRLKESIEVVKHKTGSDKVMLVAHSMGGLVSRRYLQLFGDESVTALIVIGTPNHGITDRTQRVCPLFGGKKECTDMAQGSVLLAKLNEGRKPGIPVYVVAGIGCDQESFDGVVYLDSVLLPWANNTVVNGTCSGTDFLHSSMLRPTTHPEVYQHVKEIIDTYTRME